MSVHFFVITGDFWYASVLVDNSNASFAGVMQTFLGVLYAGLDADRHWQSSASSPRQKLFASTCSPSWTACLW